MLKNILFLFLPIFFGCATPQGRLTTIVDYVTKNIPANKDDKTTDAKINTKEDKLSHKPDTFPPEADLQPGVDPQLEVLKNKIDKLETMLENINTNLTAKNKVIEAPPAYKFDISKVWNYVLTGPYEKEVYHGISLTGTSPNNLFSFKLMFTVSRELSESTSVENVPMPEDLQYFLPYKSLVRIDTEHKLTNIVIMPAVTVPIVHYKLKLGFGSEPVFNTSIELRTGLAYDINLYFRYSNHKIILFEGKENKIYLPNSLSDKGVFGSITTINLDVDPFHFETNFIINPDEVKIALGVGLVW